MINGTKMQRTLLTNNQQKNGSEGRGSRTYKPLGLGLSTRQRAGADDGWGESDKILRI